MQLVLAAPPQAGNQHPDQATVEAHAAFPDPEQQGRIVQKRSGRIEQHVANAPAQHHTDHGVEQQVGERISIDPGQGCSAKLLALSLSG